MEVTRKTDEFVKSPWREKNSACTIKSLEPKLLNEVSFGANFFILLRRLPVPLVYIKVEK